MLAVAEHLAVNAHDAVLVRQQIVDRRCRRSEEVEVRFRHCAAGTCALGIAALCHATLECGTLFTGRGSRGLSRLLREFPDVGRAFVPRIQQEARSREHVAGEKFLVTPIEDVAVLVADFASTCVEVWQPRRRSGRGAESGEISEVAEDSAAWLEARRSHMHACEWRGVCELHRDRIRRGNDRGDLQGRDDLGLEVAARAEEPSRREFACGNLDRDVAFLAAQPERVVARRQLLDEQETAVRRQLCRVICDGSACANFEKRHRCRQPVLRVCGKRPHERLGQRHTDGVAFLCMQHRGPCALEIIQLP